MSKARLRFLGTGTSQGIPIIGCRCPKCSSTDQRDKRFRSSALVEYQGLRILIDVGPDFRSQMLAAGVQHLDAIFLTHNHKDHTGGLDDVRALNYVDRKVVEIYCENYVIDALRKEYGYAFLEDKYPGAPEWHVHEISDKPFALIKDEEEKALEWIHDVGYRYKLADGSLVPTGTSLDKALSLEEALQEHHHEPEKVVGIIPIRGFHDKLPVLGFRFGNIAYITDMSNLPESEYAKLEGLDHLTLNTVGYKEHHSHFSLYQALEIADRIGAKNTWLTHLSHTFPVYSEFCDELDKLCKERNIRSTVRPAYDGLIIE